MSQMVATSLSLSRNKIRKSEGERSRCLVHIPKSKISVFIGLKRAHVCKFEELYDVKLDTINENNAFIAKILGKPVAVPIAKTAMEEWVVSRAEAKENTPSESKQCRC